MQEMRQQTIAQQEAALRTGEAEEIINLYKNRFQ